MSDPEVSFIIPSYNSKETLPLCLHAIRGQKTDVPFEVLIIDSSGDGTSDALSPAFPEVSWVHLPARVTPGAARNLGLERAAAPITVFVDSDVLLNDDWLEKGLALWNSRESGICGAVEPFPEVNPIGFCHFLIQFSKFLPIGFKRPLSLAPGLAFMVRKTDARDAGGFPEEFPMLEDFLFSHRLLTKTGHPFLFCPDMKAFHVNKKGWSVIASQLSSHGLWSARARLEADLPGRFLTRGRLAVPLLVPYRLMLILVRTLRWNPLAFLRSLLLMPALTLGLSVWARSFLKGCRPRQEKNR